MKRQAVGLAILMICAVVAVSIPVSAVGQTDVEIQPTNVSVDEGQTTTNVHGATVTVAGAADGGGGTTSPNVPERAAVGSNNGGTNFNTAAGEGTILPGAVVYQGEEHITFGGGLSSSLTGVGGDAEGQVLSPPIPQDQTTGRYSNDGTTGTPAVTVNQPRITELEIRNQNGADITGGTVGENQAANLRVYAESNYENAEDLEITVENSDGLDVTDDVLKSSTPDAAVSEIETNSVDSSTNAAVWAIDLTDRAVGTFTIEVAGVDDLDFGSAAQTATVGVTANGTSGTEGDVNIQLVPTDQAVSSNSTATYAVEITNATGGIGSYEFVISPTDTGIATIDDVTLQGLTANSLTSVDLASDGSHVTIIASNTDTGTGTVTAMLVTVSGENSGETTLDLQLRNGNPPADESGNSYTVGRVRDATVTVSQSVGPGDLTGDGNRATDPDGDGAYEDINGDQSVTAADVTALFDLLVSGDLPANAETLDINSNNDGVTAADVTTLFNEVLGA